ncbi:hypothetical protein [Nonomuraea phyllanthi]|uniref:hypothetical protein n=1 Tax=Nonomuraea phyllanthi TaxID=2219224 RepID=UPI0012930A61|nr:hypothetical protein [Nonomuraea phyllanthi]
MRSDTDADAALDGLELDHGEEVVRVHAGDEVGERGPGSDTSTNFLRDSVLSGIPWLSMNAICSGAVAVIVSMRSPPDRELRLLVAAPAGVVPALLGEWERGNALSVEQVVETAAVVLGDSLVG